MASQSRRLEEHLECGICLDRYINPRMLPCQHTYCAQCLSALPTDARNQVSCPNCRRQHAVPSNGFPPNFALQGILEATSPPNVPTSPPPPSTSAVQSRPQPSAPPLSQTINSRPIPTLPSSPDRITTARGYIDRFRQTVKNVLRRFVRDHYDRYKGIICGIFLVITIARFVAGATKLGSSCEKERNVGTYLFVKATLGFIFWIALMVLGIKGHMERALKNLFVEIYIYVDFLFAVVWFIVGMAWCFGNYRAMTLECPYSIHGWDFHFINFALFLTVSDMIIFCVFIFYALYTVFDNEDE